MTTINTVSNPVPNVSTINVPEKPSRKANQSYFFKINNDGAVKQIKPFSFNIISFFNKIGLTHSTIGQLKNNYNGQVVKLPANMTPVSLPNIPYTLYKPVSILPNHMNIGIIKVSGTTYPFNVTNLALYDKEGDGIGFIRDLALLTHQEAMNILKAITEKAMTTNNSLADIIEIHKYLVENRETLKDIAVRNYFEKVFAKEQQLRQQVEIQKAQLASKQTQEAFMDGKHASFYDYDSALVNLPLEQLPIREAFVVAQRALSDKRHPFHFEFAEALVSFMRNPNQKAEVNTNHQKYLTIIANLSLQGGISEPLEKRIFEAEEDRDNIPKYKENLKEYWKTTLEQAFGKMKAESHQSAQT